MMTMYCGGGVHGTWKDFNSMGPPAATWSAPLVNVSALYLLLVLLLASLTYLILRQWLTTGVATHAFNHCLCFVDKTGWEFDLKIQNIAFSKTTK
jgi:hypothetical protein